MALGTVIQISLDANYRLYLYTKVYEEIKRARCAFNNQQVSQVLKIGNTFSTTSRKFNFKFYLRLNTKLLHSVLNM